MGSLVNAVDHHVESRISMTVDKVPMIHSLAMRNSGCRSVVFLPSGLILLASCLTIVFIWRLTEFLTIPKWWHTRLYPSWSCYQSESVLVSFDKRKQDDYYPIDIKYPDLRCFCKDKNLQGLMAFVHYGLMIWWYIIYFDLSIFFT